MDRLAIPPFAGSLLDMDVDKANILISHALDQCMKGDDPLDSFIQFAERFSEGTVTIDYGDIVKMMVKNIISARSIIQKNMHKYFQQRRP